MARQKTGGRKAGTKNKRTEEVDARLKALGCDPIEGMARIALGDVPCMDCSQTGYVTVAQFISKLKIAPFGKYKDDPELIASDMIYCAVCGGTGIDTVDIRLRSDMFKELAQYVAPKRKAIELSVGGGGGGVIAVPVILSEKEFLNRAKIVRELQG